MAVVFTSDQETRCSISGVFLVLGIVAFVLSGYFFVRASDGDQSATLDAFRAAEQAWHTSNRQAFENVGFNVTATLLPGVAVPLLASTTPDTFVVPEVKVEYTALKYVTATPSSFPGVNYSLGASMSLDFTSWDASTGAHQTSFSFGPVKLFSVETLHISRAAAAARAKCEDEYKGLYDAALNRCSVYKRLQTFCLQVERDASGDWKLLTPTTGCLFAHGSWLTSSFSDLSSSLYDTQAMVVGTQPVPMSSVNVMLRSSQDPYLLGEQVTEEKLDFGLSASQLRWTAVGMIFVGLMLCINPVLFFCKVRDMCIADKARHGDEFHPVMAGLGGPRATDGDAHSVGSFDSGVEWTDDMLRQAHGQGTGAGAAAGGAVPGGTTQPRVHEKSAGVRLPPKRHAGASRIVHTRVELVNVDRQDDGLE